MKKTLFLMMLAGSLLGGISHAEDISVSGAVTKTNLALNAGDVFKNSGAGWADVKVNGLSGGGAITFDRGWGNGNNGMFVWLDGETGSYSGNIYVGNAQRYAGVAMILGGANAVDLSNAKATIEKNGIMLLVNDANLATAEGKSLSMSGGEIRHIAAPASFNAGINIADDSHNTNLPAVTDSSVTLTLGDATLTGTTIREGVNVIIQGNGKFGAGTTVNGKVTVNSGAALDLTLGKDAVVAGTEKAYTGDGNGFGTANYSAALSYLTTENDATVTINGQTAQFSDGIISATNAQSSIYYVKDAGASVDLTGALEVVVSAGEFTLSQATTGYNTQMALTVTSGTTTLTTSGDKNRLAGDITVKDGATLAVGAIDSINYKGTNAIAVERGATLKFDSNRWTMGANNSLTVGGSITGSGEGSNGALDFFEDGTIHADGTEGVIEAVIRARDTTVTLETEQGEKLSITGNITKNINPNGSGHIRKTGVGILELSGNNDHDNTAVTAGTLVVKSASALGKGAVSVASGATLEIAELVTAEGFSSLSFDEGASAVINGKLTLSNDAVTLNALTMGAGGLLELNSHNGTLTTTSALTVNGSSTLNANLVMTEGTMSFAGGAQLTLGCSVEIGEGVKIVLTDADIAMIQSGQTVDLILDAEEITLGNGVTELSNVYRQNSVGELIKLSSDFKIVADYDNHKIYAMPEPATATLSLLALAGLAARRRRH